MFLFHVCVWKMRQAATVYPTGFHTLASIYVKSVVVLKSFFRSRITLDDKNSLEGRGGREILIGESRSVS